MPQKDSVEIVVVIEENAQLSKCIKLFKLSLWLYLL